MEHTQTSLYYYAKMTVHLMQYGTVEANEAGASPYKRTLKSVSGKKYVTTHEYQIKGLVPGGERIRSQCDSLMKMEELSGKHIST